MCKKMPPSSMAGSEDILFLYDTPFHDTHPTARAEFRLVHRDAQTNKASGRMQRTQSVELLIS